MYPGWFHALPTAVGIKRRRLGQEKWQVTSGQSDPIIEDGTGASQFVRHLE